LGLAHIAVEVPAEHTEEIQSFGAWFCTNKLPEPWALLELKNALTLTGGAIHPSHQILKCLRKITDGLPGALGYLILLAHGRAATHNLYYWDEDLRALLVRANDHGGTLAVTTREIASRLTARRLVGYDDLFG
jgi:hypothetical protein